MSIYKRRVINAIWVLEISKDNCEPGHCRIVRYYRDDNETVKNDENSFFLIEEPGTRIVKGVDILDSQSVSNRIIESLIVDNKKYVFDYE